MPREHQITMPLLKWALGYYCSLSKWLPCIEVTINPKTDKHVKINYRSRERERRENPDPPSVGSLLCGPEGPGVCLALPRGRQECWHHSAVSAVPASNELGSGAGRGGPGPLLWKSSMLTGTLTSRLVPDNTLPGSDTRLIRIINESCRRS